MGGKTVSSYVWHEQNLAELHLFVLRRKLTSYAGQNDSKRGVFYLFLTSAVSLELFQRGGELLNVTFVFNTEATP